MIFSEIYQTRIEDYDKNGRLSVEAVLRIFENIGSHHSDSVSNSVIEGSLKGIAWILAEWRTEINFLPEYGEKIKAETWINGKAPAASVCRNFVLSDGNGVIYVKGIAKFALFDLINERPTRISEELFEMYKPESESVFQDSPLRLKEPERYDFEKHIHQRRNDIDFNGHVHNVNYLVYALETLPEDIYENASFKQIRIVYRSPLSPKDSPVIKLSRTDDGIIIGVYSEKRLCSLIKLLPFHNNF